MNIEDKLKEAINDFKADMHRVADEAISVAYGEVLPHVCDDTEMNVQYRSQRVIENIISGAFNRVSDSCVVVLDDNEIDVKIKITNSQWDKMRKSLIEVMPACPKDLEIESLKNTIKLMEQSTLF